MKENISMEILRFNKSNSNNYRKFINKYNNIIEFDTLNIQNFNIGEKEIFLLVDKGIVRKYKILAYSIIEKELKYLYIVNLISKKYENNGTTIFISDFMVKKNLRNKGIGTKLAQYLIDYIYIDKNIILQPEGDGYWFWKKFGFEEDNESEKMTWKITDNRR